MQTLQPINSILYVEDEKKVQEELSEIIGLFCETIYLADNGAEGLELYKEHKPDIIISDIQMPLMDGIAMSKAIKKLDEDARIIFTTAFSETHFFQEAIELQVDGYILKPIDLALLEKKIKSVIKDIELKKERKHIQESKLNAMSEMLSAIAHQWRQPLNVINGVLFNLSDAYENDDLSQEYFDDMLEIANKNLKHMSETIDDFKNFSKPSVEGEFTFEAVVTALNSILLAQLEAKGISLSFELEKEILIHGNEHELEHVLLNLINNARDAILESKREDGKILVEVKKEQKTLCIYVRDNARGIPLKIQERIFEPYFTTKEEGKGTGIGLHLTKRVIEESFGGTIELKHSDSKGSTFVIKFKESSIV